MSHFVVYVLTAPGRSVEDALAPYSENLDVAEYDRKCYCVGRLARRESRESADLKCGNVGDLKATFHAKHGAGPSWPDKDAGEAAWAAHDDAEEKHNALWREHIAPYEKAEADALAAHPQREAPDADCKECKGTGTYRSTRNPKSKWDWWTEGGRWPGQFKGEDSATVAKVRSMRDGDTKKFTPFALVDAAGEWHERGRMGWFACVSDEKDADTWAESVGALLAAAPEDTTVTAVDCHI